MLLRRVPRPPTLTYVLLTYVLAMPEISPTICRAPERAFPEITEETAGQPARENLEWSAGGSAGELLRRPTLPWGAEKRQPHSEFPRQSPQQF